MRNKKLMAKPKILNNVEFEDVSINAYKLHSALNCQREIRNDIVEQIYNDWMKGYYDRPLVNYIDDTYRLIGGQHTVAAYIKRIENGLENNVMIDCKMARNLTPEQESALFKYDEDCSRSQTYDSKLASYWNFTSADLSDTENRKLHDVNEIINKHGYTIKCNKNGNMSVDCTETLLNIDDYSLEKIFNFIENVFPNDKTATQAMFIKSVGYFLDLFGNDIDVKKFKNGVKATKTRKLITASDIIEDGKRYVQYKNSTKKQIAYALAITYQNRVKKSNLPLYKFDMR